MLEQVRAELAPTDVLRAAINLSNFLLVSDRTPSGDPIGVSPDMAAAVAERLGVPVAYILYDTPEELSDTAVEDIWDIGNLGAKPERAKTIRFTDAYAEIEATYLVPVGSSIN
jgi:polar amino acid transport system substrate-binding protein